MSLDKPRSKIPGRRFRPDSQSMDFYKNGRLQHTKITVRNTGGFEDHEAELIARRIMRWLEGPGPQRNEALIDKQRHMEAANAERELAGK